MTGRATLKAPYTSESDLHRAVAAYLDCALPAGAWWRTIANESPAGRGWQGKLKGRGVRAGTPDILIVWRGQAIFIELKFARGSLSPAQSACHQELIQAGAVVGIARSLEAVAVCLARCGVPLKAKVAA